MEPGWRLVRACSLPVLHRNEAWMSYMICPRCRPGNPSSCLQSPGNREKAVLRAPRRGDPPTLRNTTGWGGRRGAGQAGGKRAVWGTVQSPCLLSRVARSPNPQNHTLHPHSKPLNRTLMPRNRAGNTEQVRGTHPGGPSPGCLSSECVYRQGGSLLAVCSWVCIGF